MDRMCDECPMPNYCHGQGNGCRRAPTFVPLTVPLGGISYVVGAGNDPGRPSSYDAAYDAYASRVAKEADGYDPSKDVYEQRRQAESAEWRRKQTEHDDKTKKLQAELGCSRRMASAMVYEGLDGPGLRKELISRGGINRVRRWPNVGKRVLDEMLKVLNVTDGEFTDERADELRKRIGIKELELQVLRQKLADLLDSR